VTLSRTYKDVDQNRVLEVVKREDGTFDFLLNRRLYLSQIPEDGLADACGRFGYCGEEYRLIRRELDHIGRKKLLLSA